MNEADLEYDVSAEAFAIGLLSHTDIAPLMDALNERLFSVKTTRFSTEPPAASGIGPDVALVLTFLADHGTVIAGGGAALFWGGFLKKMGEDSWSKLREALGQHLARGKIQSDSPMGRKYCPLVMTIDTMHFVFEGAATPEEVRFRMQRAADYVGKLPNEETLPRFRNPYRNWCYWNEQEQGWEARIAWPDEIFETPKQ